MEVIKRRRIKTKIKIKVKETTKNTNNLLIRTLRGEKLDGDHIPVWLMRQAGRYLPEFRKIRKDVSFLDACKDSQIASELTIQPYLRFPSLDACIVFSDILTINVAMGQNLEMVEGKGPVLFPRLDIESPLPPWLQLKPNIDSLSYVPLAITETAHKLQNSVPVIGFSGAPWTIFCYMVEGGGSKEWTTSRRWIYERPEDCRLLLHSITDICIEYLITQYDAGATVLQVFDSHAGNIPIDLWISFACSEFIRIPIEVKRRRPQALLIGFPKDVSAESLSLGFRTVITSFNDINTTTNNDMNNKNKNIMELFPYDGISVSWKQKLSEYREVFPDVVLQGNLDPAKLYCKEKIKEHVTRMILDLSKNGEGNGYKRFIANLGHGMLPDMEPEMVEKFIDAVKSFNF